MKKIPLPIISFLLVVLVSVGIYLYSTGYRINIKKREITSSGMIAVKSTPDGAQVYLDGILMTATNGTIQNLKPGRYELRVVKNGFVAWTKIVEVFDQLVTDITAVLISKTPRLEPLTSEGARGPSISPSLNKIAYFTKNGKHPGVWVFPLGGSFQVNIFKSSQDAVLKDTDKIIYSNGQSIEWSPDEKEILVKMDETKYILVDLNSPTPQATTTAVPIRKKWNEEVSKKRQIFLDRLELGDEVVKLATDSNTLWSPDEKKFLYKEKEGGLIHFKVYDLEKPLPVGEKTNYTTFSIKEADPEPKVYWYSDSFHLILVGGDIQKEKKGAIYLIRIDGTNKTEVYNNTLYSDMVFPTPSGDKIVILTTYKSDAQTDLYAIGIR